MSTTNQLREIQLLELEIAKEIRNICERYKIHYFLVGGTLLGAVRHKGFIPWDDDMDIGMLRKDYERFLKCAKKDLPEKFVLSTWDDTTDYALPFAKVQLKDTLIDEPVTQGLNLCHGIWVDIFPYDSLPIKCFFYNSYRYRLKIYYLLNLIQSGYHLERSYHCTKTRKLCYMLLRSAIIFSKNINYRKKCQKMILKYNDIDERKVETSGILDKRFIFPSSYFKDFIPLTFEGESFLAPTKYDKYLHHAYGDYMQLPPDDQRVAWHGIEQVRFSDELLGQDKEG